MKHTVENLKCREDQTFLQCKQALILKANKIRDEQLTTENYRLPNPMLSASYVSTSFEKVFQNEMDFEFEDYILKKMTKK